ncbi:MAG: substrate-binding domain-containing protein [Ruminococcus sp.]|nr:substrate-binding domain-containing protein [Ruminococcus sp.]
MKTNIRKFISSLTLGALMVSLALSGGCGKNNDDEIYVAVIIKSKDQYWDATKKGAEDAGEEMDIRITYEAPENEDVDAQVKYVNNAIENKADAIVIAPVEDSDELAAALKKAQSNNIHVIAIDSDIREEERTSCISTNNQNAGAIAARTASEILGGRGNVGIITHTPTSPTAIERKGGFETQISTYSDDSEENTINIVAVENGDGLIEQSKEVALKLIDENPDIELIFTTNQGGTIGACMAIDELDKADEIAVIGFDFFTNGKNFKNADEYIDSGVLDGVIVQNPYNMGYLGVRYARNLVNGESIAASIDTGATLVTKDNIKDSDVQLIMNPMEN